MNLWQAKLTEEKSHEIKDMKDIYIQITPPNILNYSNFSEPIMWING